MMKKFIKELKRYLDNYKDSYSYIKIKPTDEDNSVMVPNFVFEDDKGNECCLSYKMAEFIKYMIDSTDQLDYDLCKELDYSRLLRKENEELKEEYNCLEEEFERFREGSLGVEINLSNNGLLN